MKNKIHYKTIEKLFKFTRQTWSKWHKEARPIVNLLNYFNNEEIEEFLQTGKMAKLELINNYNLNELSQLLLNVENMAIVNKGVLRLKLEKFDRASLVYFLYIFKKVNIVYNYESFVDYINANIDTPDSLILKIRKFFQSLEPTYLGNDNLSFKGHVTKFNKFCERYLDINDINYILKNKDEYYNIIFEIAEEKR